MITIQNLTYRYTGKRALEGVSCQMAAGSITALVGPNGAGKTTLLRCLAALDHAQHGQILIDGLDTRENPREVHQRLAFLADDFGLYQDLSAEQCLQYAALARKVPAARIKTVAAQVGLLDKLSQKAGSLSRGQRQRLAIAQSILHQPKVLLLDEPASGLDPDARSDLAHLMKTLASEGMTLVVSSHILAELEEYCTAMLVLQDGQLKEHLLLGQGGFQQQHSVPSLLRTCHLRLLNPAPLVFAHPLLHEWQASDKNVRLVLAGGDAEQAALLQALLQAGVAVVEIETEKQSLQAAYKQVVQYGAKA
jgi:ABC-2 type transport system ATP-binding protein